MAFWTFTQKADQAVVAGPLGGTTQSLAWGANNTVGDFLACVVSWNGAQTITSVADTLNTWSSTAKLSNGTLNVQLFYVPVCVAGTTPTVTITFSGTGATTVQISLGEWTPPSLNDGGSYTVALDGISAAGTGTSTSALSGTLTTANANELLIGYGATGIAETWTGGAGFTLRTTSGSRGNAMEDSFLNGNGGVTDSLTAPFTIGASVAWVAGVAAIKPGANNTTGVANPGLEGSQNRFGARLGMLYGNTLPQSGQILPLDL